MVLIYHHSFINNTSISFYGIRASSKQPLLLLHNCCAHPTSSPQTYIFHCTTNQTTPSIRSLLVSSIRNLYISYKDGLIDFDEISIPGLSSFNVLLAVVDHLRQNLVGHVRHRNRAFIASGLHHVFDDLETKHWILTLPYNTCKIKTRLYIVTDDTMTDDSSNTAIVKTSICPTVDQPHTLIAINVASQLPIKLTAQYYSVWHAQFNSLLIGYDLLGFVNGSKPCPPETTMEPNSTENVQNPVHIMWICLSGSTTFERHHWLRLYLSHALHRYSSNRLCGMVLA